MSPINTAKCAKLFDSKLSKLLGTATMISWTIIIGVVGFLLALGVTYALRSNNAYLLVLCCSLLSMPVGLAVLWGICLAGTRMLELAVQSFTPGRLGEKGYSIATAR